LLRLLLLRLLRLLRLLLLLLLPPPPPPPLLLLRDCGCEPDTGCWLLLTSRVWLVVVVVVVVGMRMIRAPLG
jgi:hypothetical protein